MEIESRRLPIVSPRCQICSAPTIPLLPYIQHDLLTAEHDAAMTCVLDMSLLAWSAGASSAPGHYVQAMLDCCASCLLSGEVLLPSAVGNVCLTLLNLSSYRPEGIDEGTMPTRSCMSDGPTIQWLFFLMPLSESVVLCTWLYSV